MSEFLFRIIRPQFWIMNYPVCDVYDSWLNKHLDSKEEIVVDLNSYCCNIEGKKIWIENYPYAYGVPKEIKVRPHCRTIKRLKDRVGKGQELKIRELFS